MHYLNKQLKKKLREKYNLLFIYHDVELIRQPKSSVKCRSTYIFISKDN